MAYEFDKIIDRKGTNCLKYDFARERGHSEEELPLWVADMDFQTARRLWSACKDLWPTVFSDTAKERTAIFRHWQAGMRSISDGR